MITYYIYHIEGIKIGCTINPNERVKHQGYSKFEIIEVHNDEKMASLRENQLQNLYGYKNDNIEYSHIIKIATPESRKKGGEEFSKRYSKPIIAIKIEDGSSTEYISRKECARILGINAQCIFKVICGIAKTYKGYTFKYKKNEEE